MDHGSMNGMNMAPSSNLNSTMGAMGHKKMMMHMTFYWGKNALILFNGWPGTHTGMYVLSLIFVFLMAFSVEGFSRSRFAKDNGRNVVVSGVMLTLLHTVRMGLAYLIMLAVMSFNAGVFIAAIAGHAIGFFVFGTGVFIKGSQDPGKTSDLPPMSC
ncbi:copper transporter 6-like [Chenopodium quinoa]|uniref:Copper transport protein n=1 Tax=Chenopodium quinoa TaxID=63459 RepID=A0A803LX58_CHEQI|nr:copper transporter 6-like [Chenopodium quinoa]